MTPEQIQLIVDSINQSTWALTGSIWALIFAVTWKG